MNSFVLAISRAICAHPTPSLPWPRRRSLDLAHLRTALWFHVNEPLDRFISLDATQRQAAKELGSQCEPRRQGRRYQGVGLQFRMRVIGEILVVSTRVFIRKR